MEDKLKKRLIGAAALVALVVIFVPMMFEKPAEDRQIKTSNIPPAPPGLEKFASSAVTPIPAEKPLPLPESPQPAAGMTTPPAPIAPSKPEPVHTLAPPPAKTLAETPTKKSPKTGTETAALPSPSPAPALTASKPVVPTSPAPIPTPKAGPGAWVVQMGAFASRENADKLARDLRAAKFPVIEDEIKVNDQVLRRIRVGPGVDRRLTEEMAANISRKVGVKGVVVRYP